MNHSKNFYNILFVVNDLSHTILKKIDDYKNHIESDTSLKRRFYNIEFVYMHSIILDIAKLISATGSDKSGLKQLKEVCTSKIIRGEIDNFESKYKNTLEKIKANRNKIIAHVDVSDAGSYFDMGFSETEINKKITDLREYFKHTKQEPDSNLISQLENLKAGSSIKERYSPSDFVIEIPVLENMVKEILKISTDLNLYFYKAREGSKRFTEN
jgi:hypothetical protein